MEAVIDNERFRSWVDGAGFALLMGTFFTLPLNTLRIGGVAIADFLVFALLCLVPVWVLAFGISRFVIPRWMLVSAGLLALSLVLVLALPHHFGPELYQRLTEVNEPYSSSLVIWVRLILALFLFPLAVGLMLNSSEKSTHVTSAWVAGAALSCAVAVFDVVFGSDLQSSFSYDSASIQGVLHADIYGQTIRQVGLTDHPNTLGITAAMASPLALARCGSGRGLSIFGPAFALLVAGVFLSGSRSALAGLLVGAAAVLFFYREAALGLLRKIIADRKLRFGAIAAAAVLLLAAGGLVVTSRDDDSGLTSAGPATLERVVQPDNQASEISNSARSESFSASLDAIAEYPLVGSGFIWVETPHDIVLSMLLSGGILALVGFAWALGGYLFEGFRLRGRTGGLAGPVLSGVLASALGLLVMLLLVNQTFNRYLYLPMGLILAGRLLLHRNES